MVVRTKSVLSEPRWRPNSPAAEPFVAGILSWATPTGSRNHGPKGGSLTRPSTASGRPLVSPRHRGRDAASGPAPFPVDSPGGEEPRAGVYRLAQSRRSRSLRRSMKLRGLGGSIGGRWRSATSDSDRTMRSISFRRVSQGDRRGCRAEVAIPVAEDDCGGFGLPCCSLVQVVASDVGEEHTIGRRCGHALAMHPMAGGCQGRLVSGLAYPVRGSF